jgi:hypothetical protein
MLAGCGQPAANAHIFTLALVNVAPTARARHTGASASA